MVAKRLVNSKCKSALEGRKALVVGGSGFIGKALTRRLLELKCGVVCLRLQAHRMSDFDNYNMGVPLVADVRKQESLDRLRDFAFDYVFNLGGYIDHSPYRLGGREVIETHYVGVLNLLDFVFHSNLQAFVQVGSSDEYGNGLSPQSEDLREAPISPYSAAKVGATHLIQALSRTEGFPGVVVRLFLVYGPGQDDRRFLPQVIKGCLDGRTFATSLGKQLRDFCYVEDVIEALILSAVKPEARGHVINVASGEPITIREVVEKVVSIIGGGKPDFGTIPYRPGENMELYADISRARELLGWKASTTLEDGLRKTIVWYKRRLQN